MRSLPKDDDEVAFGRFRLHLGRRELTRDGRPVRLGPRALEILRVLAAAKGGIVGKDALMGEVWPGIAVEDNTVQVHVSALRKALDDDPDGQSHIVTVTGRGYRLAGLLPAAPAAADGRPALALPDKPSIVVLPFINLGGDPEQDYFADGMVEDITLALGRLPGLFVIGSGSAFTYRDRAADARQVGAELGVRYVLRGSVRKAAGRVRITAELADASHGGQIWADRFEGEFDDVFAMQDRIAAHVSTMIAPALRSAEIERADRKPTANLTAYDLFLRASRRPRESVEQNRESLRLLNRAIELDPSYGTAYGLAAYCHFLQKLYGWTSPSDPSLQEGLRLAHRAAETARHDSEALWMAAQTFVFIGGDYERALPLIGESLSLNPNSPAAFEASSMIHAFCGDTDIALDHSARAQRHNPRDPLVIQYLTSTAYANFYAGRHEAADRAADQVLGRDPAFPAALRLKVVTCGLLGRIDEGRGYVRRALGVQPWLTVAAMRAFYEVPLRRHPRALADYLKGLRASGVPEE